MPSFDGMNDSLAQRLEKLMADAPNSVSLVSGYRTNDQQAALYAKNPKLAAPPGKSNHERGLAADLSFADDATRQWVHAHAAEYGLFFPMSWEPWHIEPLGLTRDSDPGAYTDMPANLAPEDQAAAYFDIILGKRVVGVEDTGSAQPPATGAQPAATGGFLATDGDVDYQKVYALAIAEGASPEEAKFLAAVAEPESGYNPRAHNPNASTGDNSYGLLQINMLGQMGVNRAKQWGLSSYDDLFDPATNVRAGLDIYRSQGRNAWKNSLPKMRVF